MFGTLIRKARLDAGLTQEELATKAQLTREYVSLLELGKRTPTITVFIRLCKAVGVHPPDMLERVMKGK